MLRKYLFYFSENGNKQALYLVAHSFHAAVVQFRVYEKTALISSIRSQLFNPKMDSALSFYVPLSQREQSYFLFPFEFLRSVDYGV